MDLSVKYMGLSLKSPLIIGSSGLNNSVEKIKEYEKQGAGAVVLKSLFEEQIHFESEAQGMDNIYDYPEAIDYIKNYAKDNHIDKYLSLIKECKKEVSIPIIASVNCTSTGSWISFAKKFEAAGADAIELNVSLFPTDTEKNSAENEKIYFDIIEEVSSVVSIPIALKMSFYSAGLANLIKKLSWTKKVNAFVMFNRYYAPDIDIDSIKLTSSNVFSTAEDIHVPLRWVAIMSNIIDPDISASTGIHSSSALIKQLLAGADTVQVVSAIYKNGDKFIHTLIEELKVWMSKHNYNSINDFKGKLSYNKDEKTSAFERVQFMKHFGGIV